MLVCFFIPTSHYIAHDACMMRTYQQPQHPKACWPPCHQNPQTKESFPGHLVLVTRLLFTMPTYTNKIQQGNWTLVGTIIQRSFSRWFVPCCHHVPKPPNTDKLFCHNCTGAPSIWGCWNPCLQQPRQLPGFLCDASPLVGRLDALGLLDGKTCKIYHLESPLRPLRRRLKSTIQCFCLF